ncbi:MAG: DUF177 domain-containing protein [Chloroflexi bacterium]|nr:DUF177 domain-containing protein [Chloroflexota bacterium]
MFKTLRDVLRLNVGFILKESVGYSRKLDFEHPLLEVADDLDLPNPNADFVVSESGHIDLAPFLREEMIISRPMRPLCKPDCKGLCPQCGKDLNEGACDCVTDDVNPQLAVLKKLLGK